MSTTDLSSSTEELKCTLFNGNEYLCDVIISVKKATASISLLLCLFVIFTIILFRKYAIFTQRLVSYFCIAACIDAVMFLIGDIQPDNTVCHIQAFGLTFTKWCELLWVSCLIFNLYWNAVRNLSTLHFEVRYHLIAWLWPIFMATIPLLAKKYGPAGQWCWIVDDWKWRFFIWYLPMMVIIVFLISSYIYISVVVSNETTSWTGLFNQDTERIKQVLKEDIRQLRIYPIAYLAMSLFPLFNRIQNATSSHPLFWLTLMQVICSTLQGATFSLIFIFTKDNRMNLNFSAYKMAALKWKHIEGSLIREFNGVPVNQGAGEAGGETGGEAGGEAAGGGELSIITRRISAFNEPATLPNV